MACERPILPQPPLSAPITLEQVSYRTRRGTGLVTDASLVVRAGEHLAIIGPNGAGKTTLLRMMAGQLRPSAGRVLLGDDDLAGLSRRDRARRIAVMAQSERPDLRLRGRDYVALGRIPHQRTASASAHAAAVDQALVTAGAVSLADRPLGALSGGERQRLMLARALAQEPSVLLLDEPTNNLDPRARADLLALVAGLGITVVAILHDLMLAPEFADRVAVMQGGRIRCSARPEEALSEALIRDVFDLAVFRLPHPRDGRPLLVFDRSLTEESSA
ncbi:MAG: ABC transporter ATP-binding protein [Pseudomonadota bacterium]